jgi:hypothetical protein
MRLYEITTDREYNPHDLTLSLLWAYPEIKQLRLSNGTWNTQAITDQFAQTLQKKYPGIVPLEGSPQQARANILAAIEADNKSSSWNAGLIKGYKGDPKYPQGIETVPTVFDPEKLKFYMQAYKQGVALKLITPIPAEQWAMILLVEGRSDFGFNDVSFDLDMSPQDQKLVAQLQTKYPDLDHRQRSFIVMLRSKQQAMARTGKSFYQVWNGGTQYLSRYDNQVAAVQNPKNKPLVQAVQQAMA